ncbi:Rv3235 family protein [Herbiconiux moechotypicola]|uniref:3-hydroxyacyl-CoA dehydrogenase n=1 Tax=Herbiconiux moechotypicola TaxID=637393 RepID=A0ABP5QT92_9MICO|nr:Rv3235 family protein [Herbiconiux moechotypicola]MCS5731053.1 Rv3235 family protein [Herbiconiux moechotypicola]
MQSSPSLLAPAPARPSARRIAPAGRAAAPPARHPSPPPDDLAPGTAAPPDDAARFDTEAAGRTSSPRELPDPRPLVEALARCVVEILAGLRELDQIARWLSTDAHAHLMKRVVLARRARQSLTASPSRPVFKMGSTVLGRPEPDVVEAVVIVHGRARARAVAIRLEALDQRWRASAVHVL